MAEGLAEEEQSGTAAPASPPNDLQTSSTISALVYQQRKQAAEEFYNKNKIKNRKEKLIMLDTLKISRTSMFPYEMKTEIHVSEESSCDAPLNLKSEVIVKKN